MNNILIVDDAKLMRSMIKNILIKSGEYNIMEAEDGESALELYRATHPDLVTLDITMDIKNGVDAAREIFKLNPAAKVIMITALGQEEFLKQCVSLGVSDFIVKPFTRDRILAAVSGALNN